MTTTTNYSADDTALMIVDPYNDFMSEGAKSLAINAEGAHFFFYTTSTHIQLP
jgi:hypothetical protein